jgi:hypothetical protein
MVAEWGKNAKNIGILTGFGEVSELKITQSNTQHARIFTKV